MKRGERKKETKKKKERKQRPNVKIVMIKERKGNRERMKRRKN